MNSTTEDVGYLCRINTFRYLYVIDVLAENIVIEMFAYLFVFCLLVQA